ncbi:MAG: nucleoside monophosphate kinase [Chloroflexi bacterium CFX4]|nr:nucleoside monophosphate kinase [Chloroflexi bacterium CFX4]MDL1921765.1 nucleoside monophosphate kinase [Chloroflexi bacterium CFX3]
MATYIVLMGMQGAGKGTQAAALSQKLSLPHITTGGLFRAMDGQDSDLAREIQAIMARGDLVPDATTIEVVRQRLTKPDAANGAIFDGFPRTLPQAEALDHLLAELGSRVALVPLLTLDRQEAIERISARWECTLDPTHVYNLNTNPPKVAGICDIDGAPLRQRPDDTPEAAAKRIDTFFEKTAPLLDYYRARGLVHEVNAAQPIEAVSAALFHLIEVSKNA